MLRDKRTGRHRGHAYVELGSLEDVLKALQANNQAPDFQRFPILVKASEAEKNYSASSTLTASMMGLQAPKMGPIVGPNGKLIEAQKVYVGNLEPSVTQEQLFTLFSPFGQLDKVMLQMETNGLSKGFGFLSFRDPKDANLAIQTMAGQMVAGRPL
jgi:RNA-binding protein 39